MEEKIKLFNGEKVIGSPMPAKKDNSTPDEVAEMKEMVAELVKANADIINNKNKNSQLKKVTEAITSYENSLLSGDQKKIKKVKKAYEKAFKDFEKGLKPVIKEISSMGGRYESDIAYNAAALRAKQIIGRGPKTHMEQATRRPSEGRGLGNP